MRSYHSWSIRFRARAARAALALLIVSGSLTSLYSRASVVYGNSLFGLRGAPRQPMLLGSAKRGILASTTPAQTITLSATDPDGANTGTARLGVPVNLTTVVTGGPYAVRGWTLQGAGTL